MLGMNAAVERLEAAIAREEPILLYGDYDVDGTTAVVLLKTAIELLGGEVRFHVPHRLREGYGLQSAVLEAAHADGVRLVITVDTGMRAFAEAETAHRLGLDLIITDHHLPGAMRQSHRARYSQSQSAQVRLSREILVRCGHSTQTGAGGARTARCRTHPRQTASQLSQDGRHRNHCRRSPSARRKSRDCRPRTSRTAPSCRRRICAPSSLPRNSIRQPGRSPDSTLPSALLPRINAAGRMDVASEIIELFCTRDAARATELAKKLERLNRERRDTEARALTAIDAPRQRR